MKNLLKTGIKKNIPSDFADGHRGFNTWLSYFERKSYIVSPALINWNYLLIFNFPNLTPRPKLKVT